MEESVLKNFSGAVDLFNNNKNAYTKDMFKNLLTSLRLFIDIYPNIDYSSETKGKALYYIAHLNYKFGNYDRAYHLAIRAKDMLKINITNYKKCFERIPLDEIVVPKNIKSGQSFWATTERPKQDIPSQLTLMIDSLSTTFREDVNFQRSYHEGEESYFSLSMAWIEEDLYYCSAEDLHDFWNHYISLHFESNL